MPILTTSFEILLKRSDFVQKTHPNFYPPSHLSIKEFPPGGARQYFFAGFMENDYICMQL